MRHIKNELRHILSRMTAITERFPVQSSEQPFRDIADAVATLTEILLTFQEEGTTRANWISDEE